MTQGKFEIVDLTEEKNRKNILDALGLSSHELDERCPVQIASAGHSKVMIGIKTREKLNRPTTELPKFG